MNKCEWCLKDKLYTEYHDNVWGIPQFESQKLWEKLILETFQAGLSWITVLRKKENFRLAFDNFSAVKIANYDEKKINDLMNNADIIRNKKKIISIIKNAKVFLQIENSIGFNNFLWKYVDYNPIDNKLESIKMMKSFSNISKIISDDMKKMGFVFCGPIIIYSLMQASGMVNDHIVSCHRYNEIKILNSTKIPNH